MKRVEVNLAQYEGKPFEKGIQAIVFNPLGNMPYTVVNLAVQEIEKLAGDNSVAVQFGKDIYCVPTSMAKLGKPLTVRAKVGSFEWEKSPEEEWLLPNEKMSREIIRRLLAKAIANEQIRRGWFVENYRMVYYWSFNLTNRISLGLMEVYPGFIFRPYIYDDGSCAVMVDPRFRFIPKRTLRDEVDDLLLRGVGKDEIAVQFERSVFIDACPIIDCKYKKTPTSECRLKGAGTKRFLSELDFTKSPSGARYKDLIQYHAKEVCLNNGALGKAIKDKPPIALVEAPNLERPLEFPLERFRQELKLHLLDKYNRFAVMKYVRPAARERWNLTRSFLPYVDGIKIGRQVSMKLIRRLVEIDHSIQSKPWFNIATFEEIPLRFGSRSERIEPFQGLERFGPYDLDGKTKRLADKLYVTIYDFSKKLRAEDIERFYNDLMNGVPHKPFFGGFKKLFRLQVPPFANNIVLSHTYLVDESLKVKQPHIAIVIATDVGDQSIVQYGPLKQKLTRMGIPSQFVLEENISSKTNLSKYAGYMKNLALSIYYKIGGVPWVLEHPTTEGICFLGLDSLTRGNVTYTSLQIFNSQGLWLGGTTGFIDSDQYSSFLADSLRNAPRIYAREDGKPPKRIVLHREGDFWPEKEVETILEAISGDCTLASVKKVGMPRVYDTLTRNDYVVKRGSYVQIDKDEAILVTSGPPHPIQGSQRPLVVKLVHPPADNRILLDICREIFHLTLVFGGYSLAITSKPITTHFANAAVGMVSKYKIRENPELFKKAWFL